MCIRDRLGEQQGRPVASDHLEFFDGRSIFLVFFQVPGGRAKTLEYLAKLRDVPKTWRPNPDMLPFLRDGQSDLAGLVSYPEPPQFPIGTRMALVRQIVLISSSGNPMRTHLTESVQTRVDVYKRQEENLTKAEAHMGSDPTVQEHLGDLYQKTGRLKLAAAHWDRAVQEWSKTVPAEQDTEAFAKVQQKLDAAKVKLAKEESDKR